MHDMTRKSLHHLNKKVLLRENARGVPTAAYPVHGWSCPVGGGGGGIPVLAKGTPTLEYPLRKRPGTSHWGTPLPCWQTSWRLWRTLPSDAVGNNFCIKLGLPVWMLYYEINQIWIFSVSNLHATLEVLLWIAAEKREGGIGECAGGRTGGTC